MGTGGFVIECRKARRPNFHALSKDRWGALQALDREEGFYGISAGHQQLVL